MKPKTAVMAGLISCTTMLHAQDAITGSPTDAGIRNLVVQVTNPSLLWTNKVSLHSIEAQSFLKGSTTVANPSRAAEFDFPSKGTDYQVIVLPWNKEATPPTADLETGSFSKQTAGADTTVFGNFTGSEVPFWIQATVNINGGTRIKNGAQVIVVEPESETTDRIRIPEHGYFIPPQTAWHEWFNPRVFIPRWAEFWMTESEATPVVLVMTTF